MNWAKTIDKNINLKTSCPTLESIISPGINLTLCPERIGFASLTLPKTILEIVINTHALVPDQRLSPLTCYTLSPRRLEHSFHAHALVQLLIVNLISCAFDAYALALIFVKSLFAYAFARLVIDDFVLIAQYTNWSELLIVWFALASLSTVDDDLKLVLGTFVLVGKCETEVLEIKIWGFTYAGAVLLLEIVFANAVTASASYPALETCFTVK